jgi:hypothetical protein
MKTNYKNLLGLAFLAMFTLTILSFTMPTGIMDDWGMDAKYKSMENPYAETEMRELGSAEVQGQKDGELFYKSIIGRDEMPNFEKKIRSDEDRWMVVNYLRTLAE